MPLLRLFQNVLITNGMLIVLQFAAKTYKKHTQAGPQSNWLRPSWAPVKLTETKLGPCQVDRDPCQLDRDRCQLDRDPCQLDRKTCQFATATTTTTTAATCDNRFTAPLLLLLLLLPLPLLHLLRQRPLSNWQRSLSNWQRSLQIIRCHMDVWGPTPRWGWILSLKPVVLGRFTADVLAR